MIARPTLHEADCDIRGFRPVLEVPSGAEQPLQDAAEVVAAMQLYAVLRESGKPSPIHVANLAIIGGERSSDDWRGHGMILSRLPGQVNLNYIEVNRLNGNLIEQPKSFTAERHYENSGEESLAIYDFSECFSEDETMDIRQMLARTVLSYSSLAADGRGQVAQYVRGPIDVYRAVIDAARTSNARSSVI